jgi:lysophospholipase L1-like esterase
LSWTGQAIVDIILSSLITMFRNSRALLLCAFAAAGAFAQDQPIRIVLVGDSTVNDQGGWGPGLRASFGPAVEVVNLALNGRSSKSFRDEGAWAKAIATQPAYILIQFGHNDGPGKGPARETDPATTYRANMNRYIEEARAAGAQPVLVTSIVRRNFTPEGKIRVDSLAPYVAEVRTLATEKNVPLIDLYSLTLEQAEKLGPEQCAQIDALDKDGKRDHTHLGPKGREEIGAMAARELMKVVPALRPYAADPR